MMKNFKSVIVIGLLSTFFVANFSGCSAMSTAIKKRNLDVQTKMSETIFLDPASPSQKVILVDIRNTSDKELNISIGIKNKLKEHGYIITNDPKKAQYMLQANVLKAEKSDLRTASSALGAGFGGALIGATIGASSGSGLDFSSKGALVGSIVGGLVSFAGDAMVEDVLYLMITDIQIKERAAEGEVIEQTQNTSASSGTSTKVNQVVKGGNQQWKIYRTRIVSTANKVNLDFKDAQLPLESGLIGSIGGIF